jgi:hypothetical protein
MQPIKNFCSLSCDAKVTFNTENVHFYHMSFCRKSKAILNPGRHSIMKCHCCVESHHSDHQLKHNIMIINLKTY